MRFLVLEWAEERGEVCSQELIVSVSPMGSFLIYNFRPKRKSKAQYNNIDFSIELRVQL